MNIQIAELSKKYGSKTALDKISIDFENKVYGLIGENGAGKTTLLTALTTILPFDSGQILVDGVDISKPENKVKFRTKIGYVPQNIRLFPKLTVYEMLEYLCTLKTSRDKEEYKEEIQRVLELVNLADREKDKIKELSGGMKQRLGIAQSLLFDPPLIVMDEPTVGLDPKERMRFRNLINRIARDKTIIISTHIIDDIAVLCDDCVILKKASVLYQGGVQELIQSVKGKIFQYHIEAEEAVPREYLDTLITVSREESGMTARFYSDGKPESGAVSECTPNLEDAYLYYISKDGG